VRLQRSVCVVVVVVVLSGLGATACDLGGGSKDGALPTASVPTGESGGTVVEIDSSLEPYEVLPRRVQWTVTTSLPSEDVREVRFGIDETRVLWRDLDPPYTFGPDGTQLGTWMGPGQHQFVVRVFATDGARTIETVTARVHKTATNKRAINGGLFQVWGRLSEADLEAPPPPRKLPDFTGALNVNQRLLFVGPARNGSFAEDVSAYEYWVRGHTLHVGTAWFAGTPDDLTAYAGWDLAQPRCPPGAWPATYTWSNEQGRRTGRFQGENTYAPYLVLTAERDPCAARRRLLEGTWEGLGT
jgi:hypothetical protein